MAAALSLTPSYYEALRRLTLELTGVALGDDHHFAIETRLSALARREGFGSLHDMVEELFARGQTRLAVNVVSALLERERRFFDDKPGIALLTDYVIPQLMAGYGGADLRILVFGCGSGQDAYSLAMTLDRLESQMTGLRTQIVAVDYPSWALERAKRGSYTHFEVQRGLPIMDLVTYFTRNGTDWRVNDLLSGRVEFTDFHLLSNPEALGKFHIILFGNALGHYSAPAQVRLLRNMAPITLPHGYLMLGDYDKLSDMNFGYDRVDGRAGLMKKREEIKAPVDPYAGRKRPTERTSFNNL
ncbi:CheR family methyltransferase [Robiginitomaculum antarcticum]|uniref:CheR family methyltransferase n=1 Tax=Robiginitomaculum antarcticum TaxID=437507 RepID=UPI00036A95EB|nr:CheR family methyltransferase [Robiginitomaculum antarcticum]